MLILLLPHSTSPCFGNLYIVSAPLVISSRARTRKSCWHIKKCSQGALSGVISNPAVIDKHSFGKNFLKSVQVIPGDN